MVVDAVTAEATVAAAVAVAATGVGAAMAGKLHASGQALFHGAADGLS